MNRYQKTKIVIITSVHVWNDTRIYYKQGISLALKGYKVVLIGISNEKRTFYENNIRVYTIKKKQKRVIRWSAWLSIIKILLKEKGEIFHLHDPELIPMGLLLKIIKRKVCFDMHEDFGKQLSDKEWIPKCLRKTLSKYFKTTQKYIPKIFNSIILAEDSYLNNFKEANNIKVIHNYPILQHAYKEDYGFKIFTMIYVGDVRVVRGIYEYIMILENLLKNGLNIKLLVIGSFAGEKLKIDVNRLIKEKRLENNFMFMGYLPNKEIYSILRSCDIGLALLHPTDNYLDSYPTKVFEYMSVGLPVLGSNFNVWESIISQNECGSTVDPLNTNKSCEIIKKYYFSEDLRKKHGTNGRKAIREKYSWENEANLLYTAYDNLIDN